MNLKCTCPDCNGKEWSADQFRTFIDHRGDTRYRSRREVCLNKAKREYYHAHKTMKPAEKLAPIGDYEPRTWTVRCTKCGRKHKKYMLWKGRQKNPDGTTYVPRFRCVSCEQMECAGEFENRASV